MVVTGLKIVVVGWGWRQTGLWLTVEKRKAEVAGQKGNKVVDAEEWDEGV